MAARLRLRKLTTKHKIENCQFFGILNTGNTTAIITDIEGNSIDLPSNVPWTPGSPDNDIWEYCELDPNGGTLQLSFFNGTLTAM